MLCPLCCSALTFPHTQDARLHPPTHPFFHSPTNSPIHPSTIYVTAFSFLPTSSDLPLSLWKPSNPAFCAPFSQLLNRILLPLPLCLQTKPGVTPSLGLWPGSGRFPNSFPRVSHPSWPLWPIKASGGRPEVKKVQFPAPGSRAKAPFKKGFICNLTP